MRAHAIRALRGLAGLAVGTLLSGRTMAAITAYSGLDHGVGSDQSASSRVNSNAAAVGFDAQVHPTRTIDFEQASTGLDWPSWFSNPTQPIPVVEGLGIQTERMDFLPGGLPVTGVSTADTDPALARVWGYNTTAGGSQFFTFAPVSGAGASSLTLFFATPVSAFGAYFTGTQAGLNQPVNIFLNDDASPLFTLPRNSSEPLDSFPQAEFTGGGVLFWGFSDPSLRVTRLTFTQTNVGGIQDIWGIDDIRIVETAAPAPLPPAAGVGVALLAGVIAARSLRRRLA